MSDVITNCHAPFRKAYRVVSPFRVVFTVFRIRAKLSERWQWWKGLRSRKGGRVVLLDTWLYLTNGKAWKKVVSIRAKLPEREKW